jgi:SAM-dependent methyltransferase
MTVTSRLLERTVVYRAWMAPQTEPKFAPIHRFNDVRQAKRVLDVGCGPGTNTSQFPHSDYLGLDINERYVEHARRRYGRRFAAVDVTHYAADTDERYDFILVNSFLHHLPTPEVERILGHLRTLLARDGHIHVLDLVLPQRRSLARLLARLDRGDYPRPLAAWRQIFETFFATEVFQPYRVGPFGFTAWNMIYFKGSVPQHRP